MRPRKESNKMPRAASIIRLSISCLPVLSNKSHATNTRFKEESCDQDKSETRVMRRPNKHSESLAATWFRVCTMSTLLGPHIAKVARTHLGLIPTLKTRVKQQSFAATWFPVRAPCRLSFELTTNNHAIEDLTCWQDTVKLRDTQDMISFEFCSFAPPLNGLP